MTRVRSFPAIEGREIPPYSCYTGFVACAFKEEQQQCMAPRISCDMDSSSQMLVRMLGNASKVSRDAALKSLTGFTLMLLACTTVVSGFKHVEINGWEYYSSFQDMYSGRDWLMHAAVKSHQAEVRSRLLRWETRPGRISWLRTYWDVGLTQFFDNIHERPFVGSLKMKYEDRCVSTEAHSQSSQWADMLLCFQMTVLS